MSNGAKVHPNFGLRKARRERRALESKVSSQRVRAAAADFTGPEMRKYQELEQQLKDTEKRLADAKQGMKATC